MQKRQKKARLSIDCTIDERRYIKMLAAREDKTISEYLVGLARKKMPHCTKNHIPNKKTSSSIEASERGEGIEKVESLDDFWKSIGC
jgi:hypothetical protein